MRLFGADDADAQTDIRHTVSVQRIILMFGELPFELLVHSVRWFIKGFSLSKEEAQTTVLLIGIRKEARSQVLHLSRNKRYTLTPEKLKWDKFKLTYKYLCVCSSYSLVEMHF